MRGRETYRERLIYEVKGFPQHAEWRVIHGEEIGRNHDH